MLPLLQHVLFPGAGEPLYLSKEMEGFFVSLSKFFPQKGGLAMLRRRNLCNVTFRLLIVFVLRQNLQAQEPPLQWLRITPNLEWEDDSSQQTPTTSGFIANIRIHPTSNTTQTEMSIAVHPLNPNVLLVGSNSSGWPTISYLSQGWYITTNAGTSWTGADTLPPHLRYPGGLSTCMSDPAVGIDRNGFLYFNALISDDCAYVWRLVMTKSTDNGATWSDFVTVAPPEYDPDKNHLAIDNTTGSGYIYAAFTDFAHLPRRIRFSRSTNGGQSWSTPKVISDGDELDQGVNLQVGRGGEVYAAWSNYIAVDFSVSHVSFARSTDRGATWSTVSNAVTNVRDLRAFMLYKGGNPIRVFSFPSMAVDTMRGWIYLVYPERVPNAGPDIKLVRSEDGGTNWSSPIRVNQDNTTRDQWYPWCAVDPSTGVLYIVYYDSRNFVNNDSAQVYVSYS